VKFLSLVWAGLRRRATRLAFTMLSIATAFVLFGMLEGLNEVVPPSRPDT
jgi:putative ABC transport system permease protein